MKTNTMNSEFLGVTIVKNLSEAGIPSHGTLDPQPKSMNKEDASDMQIGEMEKVLESASGMQSDDLKGMVGDMPPLEKSKKETVFSYSDIRLKGGMVGDMPPLEKSKKGTVFSCSDIRLKGIKKRGQNSGPQLNKLRDDTQDLGNEQLEDGSETQVFIMFINDDIYQ